MAEMQRYFIAEFQPRIDSLKADMANSQGGARARLQNRLGVYYARFGMLDDARNQFEAVLAAKGADISQSLTVAALINLGNIAYISEKYDKAYDYYGKALSLQADSPAALLGYARASFELGKKGDTDSAMQGLRKVSPSMAEKYAYMGSSGSSATRAASAEKEVSVWSDED
jgi:tetratricopeptide (TPR) repeat protein